MPWFHENILALECVMKYLDATNFVILKTKVLLINCSILEFYI